MIQLAAVVAASHRVEESDQITVNQIYSDPTSSTGTLPSREYSLEEAY